jgi:hypothetical protein
MSLQSETVFSKRLADQGLRTLRDIERRIMESKAVINFSADISVTAVGPITFQSVVALNNSN